MDNMTDAEKLARRIMARIEDDKAIHLSSIMEELVTPVLFYSVNKDAVVSRRYEIASIRVPVQKYYDAMEAKMHDGFE